MTRNQWHLYSKIVKQDVTLCLIYCLLPTGTIVAFPIIYHSLAPTFPRLYTLLVGYECMGTSWKVVFLGLLLMALWCAWKTERTKPDLLFSHLLLTHQAETVNYSLLSKPFGPHRGKSEQRQNKAKPFALLARFSPTLAFLKRHNAQTKKEEKKNQNEGVQL